MDPSTDVRDAQVLAVDGSGWIGSALVDVSVCARTDAVRCDAVAQVKSGIDGRLRGDLVARRKTPLGVDCAPMPGDCWYRFEDGLTDDVADVPFTLLASSMPRLLPPRVLRVREGDGESRVVTLAIHLDRPAEQRAVVTWLWERSDAETEARLLEAAVIPRGQRTGVLRFLVSGDRIDEPLEYYEVGLGGSNVLTLGAVVRLEIVDDDARPELRVGDAAQLEGDKVRGLCVPVRLDRQSARPIGVWIVAGGGTATSGVDYEGTVVGSYGSIIEPYTTRALVCVSGLGDRRREADETVGIVAYSAPRTTLVDAVGLATIVDDD